MQHSLSKRRVLIAVDDAVAAESAIRSARALFGDDADYLLINVAVEPVLPTTGWGQVSPMMMPFSYPLFTAGGTDGPTPDSVAASGIITHAAALQSGMAPSEELAATGDVAEAVVRAAHEHQVDVIVVGSHERSWLSRLFQPSTALDVLKHSEIPVLVVR